MFPFDFCGTRAHHLWRAHSSAQHLTTFALCLCVWGGRPYDALSLSFALYPQAEIHSRDGMQVCKEASGQAQQLCQAKRHLSLWCRLFRAAQPTRYNLSRFAGVTPVGCHDATTFSHARTHARTHTHTLSHTQIHTPHPATVSACMCRTCCWRLRETSWRAHRSCGRRALPTARQTKLPT